MLDMAISFSTPGDGRGGDHFATVSFQDSGRTRGKDATPMPGSRRRSGGPERCVKRLEIEGNYGLEEARAVGVGV
jgi:hypothetical protein